MLNLFSQSKEFLFYGVFFIHCKEKQTHLEQFSTNFQSYSFLKNPLKGKKLELFQKNKKNLLMKFLLLNS